MEMEALQGSSHGTKVLGHLRVCMEEFDKGKGFPTFIRQRFAPNALRQLLFAVQERQMMPATELQEAIKKAGIAPLTKHVCSPQEKKAENQGLKTGVNALGSAFGFSRGGCRHAGLMRRLATRLSRSHR